ncbi:hypothetical protein [Ferrimicrobium sp.]|uniref:hypothetical protein n=1 Tax=Ferrimicrobium sp. TaxID=2926050 RepID=UPI00262594DA|nr:hypothetical protein [Ferrimicrobium sp.]
MSEVQSPVPAPTPGARSPGISRAIYGMPMFTALFVLDLGAAVSWYVEGLGFASPFTVPGSSGRALLHLLRWQFQDLLVRPAPSAVTAGTGCTLSFAAVYDEVPVDTLWITRDLTTSDPDGNVVVFTAARPPGSQEPAFSKQVERAEQAVVDCPNPESGMSLRNTTQIGGQLAHCDAWRQDRPSWLG